MWVLGTEGPDFQERWIVDLVLKIRLKNSGYGSTTEDTEALGSSPSLGILLASHIAQQARSGLELEIGLCMQERIGGSVSVPFR